MYENYLLYIPCSLARKVVIDRRDRAVVDLAALAAATPMEHVLKRLVVRAVQ
jgi:hypothetical protein